MAPAPMPKDICCQNFKGLVAYIRKRYGESGFNKLTNGLLDGDYHVQDKYQPSHIVPIAEEHLIDQAYWVSNAFSIQLLHNVSAVVEGEHPLRSAGRCVVKESLSKTSLLFARFIGLERLAHRAARINRQFNRTKEVQLAAFSDKSVRFELIYKPGFSVTQDVCEWNLGIYMGIAELAGQTHVDGKETDCILHGGDRCCFEITWKKRNIMARIPRALFAFFQRWIVKDLTSDYEKILEERDQLIVNLEKSEKKYRTLFEESQEALCLSQEGVVIDINPSWLELHGYSDKNDVVGKPMVSFVHPNERRHLAGRHRNWPDRYTRMIEIQHVNQAGEAIDVEVYSSRVEFGGSHSLLTMVKDVTKQKRNDEDRKRLEARVVRAEKMETIATLAGGVAHDLNNVLSGIVGYPELILSQLPENSPFKEPIETMHRSALKAATIVQDLLTLSNRGAIGMEVINLNPIVREYMGSAEFKKLASYHPHVIIDVDLEADLSNFSGSSVHVFKVLMNLVSNAAEAMPNGGKMRVQTRNCSIDKPLLDYESIKEGEYCVLSVIDSGVGLAESDRNKIFEPFFTKKKMGRSGTGLGMAVVWGTVRDHNGYINIHSKLGKGTAIDVYFPATRRSVAVRETSVDPAMIKGSGEKILVVDDIPEQLVIAKGMLTSLNYRVEIVKSGEAAIEYLKHNACDLIVLDMVMDPGMDGLDTYTEIVKHTPHQKAVVASGYSENDRVKKVLKLGAGAYIRKPYTLAKIGLAVKAELERKPANRPIQDAEKTI